MEFNIRENLQARDYLFCACSHNRFISSLPFYDCSRYVDDPMFLAFYNSDDQWVNGICDEFSTRVATKVNGIDTNDPALGGGFLDRVRRRGSHPTMPRIYEIILEPEPGPLLARALHEHLPEVHVLPEEQGPQGDRREQV